MNREALICVDVQPDFLPGGALGVTHGREVIAHLVEAAKGVDMVVASRDWHPKDHVSFVVTEKDPYAGLGMTPEQLEAFRRKADKDEGFVQALEDAKAKRALMDRRLAGEGIWPEHCVAGTPGAEVVPEINKIADLIISKGTRADTDAYSAFSGTDLALMLKAAGITKLKIGGIATDYCVKATVLDALAESFEVTVLRAATRAVNIKFDDGENALEEMRSSGANIL